MPNPLSIDLLINARWIVPVIPENQIFEHCSLAVDKGNILALVPQQEAAKRFIATETLDLDQHLLIPGLVNTHCHSAMSLLRGYADDIELQEWLEKHIWPAEMKWVDPQFVKDGTELALAEMLRSGTTCFSDMYFYPEQVATVAQHAGARAQVNFPVLDFPSVWARGADEYINKGLALHDDYRSSELITIGFGPHAPYTVSNQPLQRIATLAEEMQAPVQIHLHETAAEVETALSSTGQRPSQRLQELGLLSPLSQCVHMTQVDDLDLEILRESGAHVIHCPESNLNLASGFCPVDRLLNAGINVALGTDGAASNNDLDLQGEMQTAALLAKGVAGNAAALDAHQTLRLATLNGARAMGLEQRIGSLEVGKAADMCAIDMDTLEATPMYNPVSLLVYTRCSHRVSHVWVNGKPLLKDRKLQTLAEHEIITKARSWQEKLTAQ